MTLVRTIVSIICGIIGVILALIGFLGTREAHTPRGYLRNIGGVLWREFDGHTDWSQVKFYLVFLAVGIAFLVAAWALWP